MVFLLDLTVHHGGQAKISREANGDVARMLVQIPVLELGVG